MEISELRKMKPIYSFHLLRKSRIIFNLGNVGIN